MIAPEPFFEPRGTPFSEYHRIRALIHLGHTVDLLARMERFVVRRSNVVVVICPHLAKLVGEIEPSVPAVLIENAPGSGDAPLVGSGQRIRAELGIGHDTPIVLYTGTFESYQGLD